MTACLFSTAFQGYRIIMATKLFASAGYGRMQQLVIGNLLSTFEISFVITEFCHVTFVEVVALLQVICRFSFNDFHIFSVSHASMTVKTNNYLMNTTNLPRCTSDIL